MASLAETLAHRTRLADLVDVLPNGWVRCVACGHQCRIPPGAVGICKVRFNEDGRLLAPWGYTAGLQCDPIEKKPFFHAWPGSDAFSFGMLGCDLHCGYCQNWVSSQALRDPRAVAPPRDLAADALISLACRHQARVVVSTYNEPLITAEWAVEIFRAARAAGLKTGFVSNGNGTRRVLDYLSPWLDVYKVDLKSFRDRQYRQLGGRLLPILDSIRTLHTRGIWLEIVTLLVPGFNDDPQELADLAAFIAGVSRDIPWHVTAFHPQYKMDAHAETGVAQLLAAVAIGRDAGLRYVYAGNLPGLVGQAEDTHCPTCRHVVVARRGFRVVARDLTAEGACPRCRTAIPGRWN